MLVPDQLEILEPELALQAQLLADIEYLLEQGHPKFATPLSPEETIMVTPIEESFKASVLKEFRVEVG